MCFALVERERERKRERERERDHKRSFETPYYCGILYKNTH